jgi:hypothetical protein
MRMPWTDTYFWREHNWPQSGESGSSQSQLAAGNNVVSPDEIRRCLPAAARLAKLAQNKS